MNVIASGNMHVAFATGSGDIHDSKTKDELEAIEEGCCISVDLDFQSSTDDLTRVIFQVQSTLLDHRPLYLQISKNEFAVLLLRALGPDKLSSSVVDDLFSEIDTDKDCLLSIEELARYMIKIEQRNRKDMYLFYYNRLVRASLLGPLAIIFANTLAIAKNLFIRFNDKNNVFESVALVTAQFGMWLALIASLLFIWGSISSMIDQLRETQEQSHSAMMQKFIVNAMSLANVINTFRMLGSIAFVKEKLLAGGMCYLAGGVLSFPNLYRSTLAELIENQELLRKLQESFDQKNPIADEEPGNNGHQVSWIMNCGSTGSDLTDISSEEEAASNRYASHLGLHKRLRSDSNATFVFKDLRVLIKDQPMQSGHKRAPTCPADIFNFQSSITYDTDDTESTKSLTDSELTVDGDKIASCANLLGKNVTVKATSRRKALHCYDVFVSFSRNEANLDTSFRLMKRLSQSNLDDMNSIHQIASGDTMENPRKSAFRELLYMASFYTSIAHTTAGLMLTIGALDLGLSPYTIQIFYMTGSSLYLSGSTGILFRAWKKVRDEWNNLQESRMALHGIAYPEDATLRKELVGIKDD